MTSFRLCQLWVCLFMIMSPAFGSASLDKEMKKFLSEVSASSNATSASIYEGQKAGYATGGGFTLRNRSSNLNPVTITLPRIDAGCGGIDIHTGGFSFIGGKQLQESLKNIASESASYAFMLGVESVSPMIMSLMKQLQTWANDINTSSINSCETAARLVGSVWPQSDMASQHICQSIGTKQGWLQDRAAERHQCNSKKEREKAFSKLAEDTGLSISAGYNIAWEAIKNQSSLVKNDQFSELLMTLMGTLIVDDEDGEFFPSKATEEGFLKALMEGGSVEVYGCKGKNSKKCLTIEPKSMATTEIAWTNKIENLLKSIQEKVVKDEGQLTQDESELLLKSRIP